MKKYFFINAMLGLLFMGCSVDNGEMNLEEDQLLIANSILDVEGCVSETYDLNSNSEEKLGTFIITNDLDELYLNFTSVEGYKISKINYEVAVSEDDLPINNGGIIVSQLEHSEKFSPAIDYLGDSFSLDSFGETIPAFLVVAARIQYMDESGETYAVWVGNKMAGKNNSKFLEYPICIPQQEPVCEVDAGSDNSVTHSYRQLLTLGLVSADVKEMYLDLLEDGVSREGTFDPTITQILNFIYANEANRYGEHSTTYTVTNELNGEFCTDSTLLTITITP
ncbi:hypothetical protein [Gramella sp. MAR_2010_147]|uniref:hypothetical protein n=1 Tax=Gramella sp. MAR_2010_147 TaxID=1250205 RepID=UPI00087CB706|nr:hypothetical protein [Gramella sp. MAR_2010_147]SDS46567.1 hypothetical protein SAMN04488553_2321 [Gramella sp. MAR_2010_147]